MKNTTPSLAGLIIWNQLHCKDVDAQLAFYNGLFGWTTKPEERETYIHLYQGERTVAGVMPTHQGDQAPPHWSVFVGTDDIEAYCQRAEAAGGQQHMPVMDIPSTGKLTAIADMEGATLCPFEPANTDREHWKTSGEPGTFCWVELLCRDAAAAKKFYGDVVGWGMNDMDMGEIGIYTILSPGGADPSSGVGGIQPMPREAQGPSCWLPYVAATDLDRSCAKAEGLGASLCVPPTEIPNVGGFAVLADPEGAMFALYRTNQG